MRAAGKFLAACGAFALFSGCVSKTFSDTSELEEYPIRDASEQERKHMEGCARALYQAQNKSMEKTGKYQRKVSNLGIDEPCQGLRVQLKGNPQHYIAAITITENDTTVKWEVNERGIVTEFGDTDTDEDLLTF